MAKLSEFDPSLLRRGAKHRTMQTLDCGMSIPVLVARGAVDGPVLVVSANVHGDEYEGVRAVYETFDELDPTQMAGDLIAVPVLNPPAFRAGTRTSPLDGANLARTFPGKPDGTPSEQLAWGFSHSILARASFYLDLHSGGVKFRMPSMAGFYSADPRASAAAEIFGASVIWGHPVIAPGRTVSFATDRNIPWIYTEARGAGRVHPDDLKMMKRGIRNLLLHLGILKGEPERVPIEFRLTGEGNTDVGSTATQSGFLINRVSMLQKVKAGELLGVLVDLMGETLEEYRAPQDGLIGLIREFPIVEANDVLYLLAWEEQ